MIRGFEEQFEGKTVDDIRQLLARIDSFSFPSGVSRYYAVDLSLCLQAGALLGALQVVASLLEIFVREIVLNGLPKPFQRVKKSLGHFKSNLNKRKMSLSRNW